MAGSVQRGSKGNDSIVHQGRVTAEGSSREPYLYLPFRVTEGTSRIDVRLKHDRGNVVDLGILDVRAGSFPSKAGFRGWSGGARDCFFLATNDATPGYVPGVIPAGSWKVILGLYRISRDGCRFRVEIDLTSDGRELIAPPRPHPSFKVPAGWYPGDLQSHTHHSDARGSLEDLVAAARDRGLRFLAVTDHNTTSHHRYLAEASSEELFLLPGEEVTTDSGHANVWGASDWVDFRITEAGHVETMVERAHELGGLVSINHPKPGGPDWRYEVPAAVDCVEAWQAPWPARNEVSVEFYDRLLREGRRLVLVGGSDRHQPGWPESDPPELRVGSPTTWLWLDELSVPACLTAIKSGHLFVSESPAGPRLELSLDGVAMGGVLRYPTPAVECSSQLRASVRAESNEPVRLRLVGSHGAFLEQSLPGGANSLRFDVDPGEAIPFVRAELLHAKDDRVLALSNPVFVGRRPGRPYPQ